MYLICALVFFNGPRAGVNFNDGFGGGNEVTQNLIFSTCRESGDHGPFNSVRIVQLLCFMCNVHYYVNSGTVSRF